MKLQAKPFVDVTVDRMAKGIGALVLLVFIKPWGLGFTWQQLSFVTLALVAVWFVMAVKAKREYVAEFRRSIQQQDVQPPRFASTPPTSTPSRRWSPSCRIPNRGA